MNKPGLLVGCVLVAGLGLTIWQVLQPAEQSAGSMVHPDRTSLTDLAEGAPIVEVRLPAQLSPEATIGKRDKGAPDWLNPNQEPSGGPEPMREEKPRRRRGDDGS